MSTYIYTTAADAIEQAIIPAIEGTGVAAAAEYDVQQILDRAFEYSADLGGFVQIADVDEFWAIVAEAEK